MAIGPVEYLVVGFPGNKFTGRIAPELAKLIDSGAIRVLDLVFIAKDSDGTVMAVEVDELDELKEFAALDGEAGGLIGSEDIEHAASALPPDTSAALLIWEDRWAQPFAEAVRGADGVVLEGGRIPHELLEPALANLASTG